jgi:glycosyltransferase involved in cell wall biosynthesis
MKLLVIANYPRRSHQFAGIFNARCIAILGEFCDRVEVIAHRPYVPFFLSHNPRWKSWIVPKGPEVVDGILIHRPVYLQVPRVRSDFWIDKGAFFWCRRLARELHHRIGFDAILSFNLLGAGGLAWRLGYDLGIPAIGWATGSDIRQPAATPLERLILRTINCLDLVFYQSQELLEIAARLSGITPAMIPKDKHVVLSRGISEPPSICRTETRARVRMSLGIKEDTVLVLSVGRIERSKGVFELLQAVSLAAAQDSRICCRLLGSMPALDETVNVEKLLDRTPILRDRVKLLPACRPDEVWEYLLAADIFAFASHNEGMPNSLLEAMAVGLPSIAFAIPPVLDIEADTGALIPVSPFDLASFGEAILRLANSADERMRIGEIGKRQVMERYMVRNKMAQAFERVRQIVNKRNSLRSCGQSSTSNEIGPASLG